jgi:hypothetical protein
MKSLLFYLLPSIFYCQLSAQVSFTISPSICKNDTIYLAANTGSLANCTFSWICSPTGAGLSSPNNSITSISFMNPGTYTIMLTVTSGTTVTSCQNSVTAVPLPTITLAQSSFTTCITNNFPLFSKPIHLIATGGLTYTWNPPITPLAGNPNGASNDVRPTANACFSVTGQDANGCKAMASTCVTVIPRFTINVSPTNTMMCRNGFSGPNTDVELIANNPSSPAYGLPGSCTYSWTGGGILTPPYSATVYVAPLTTATYTAEIKDSLGCVSLPAMVTVSVQNCTGILKNSLDDKDLFVYPNPVKDKLSLLINSKSAELKLKLTNSSGQTVKELENLETEIDVSYLTPGIYFLSVESFGKRKICKIFKE